MESSSLIFYGELASTLQAYPPFDWINKAIAHPIIIAMQEALCEDIVSYGISNPIQLAKHIIREHKLEGMPPRLFYQQVLKNSDINSLEKFDDAILILEVSKNREEALRHIQMLMSRFVLNSKYKDFIFQCKSANIQVNTFWSDERIVEEAKLLDCKMSITYVGEIILPENAKLITRELDLFEEGRKMHHCIASFWERIEERRCFVIKTMCQERVTCLIERSKYMGWFEVSEIQGFSNSKPSTNVVSEFVSYVSKPENQQFFRENYSLLEDAEHFRQEEGQSIFLQVPNRGELAYSSTTMEQLAKLTLDLQCNAPDDISQYKGKVEDMSANLSLRGDTFIVEISSDDFLSQIDIIELLRRERDAYQNRLCDEHKARMLNIDGFFYDIQAKRIKECFQKLVGNEHEPLVEYTYDNLQSIYEECNMQFGQVDLERANDYLTAIQDKGIIVDHLAMNGYYVERKSNSSTHSLKRFLCRHMGIGEITSDDTLLESVNHHLSEPVFPLY